MVKKRQRPAYSDDNNKTDSEIGSLVRRFENDYVNGKTTIGKYVEFSQYETIETIDAYLNSKHISGPVDSLDREKPFFNIVTAIVNIWWRATDIDRKNIRIKAGRMAKTLMAFAANLHLKEWMRREMFGRFLNEWGRAQAEYGSIPLKFVEQDDKLHCLVVPWNRMISDTVDFENNPKIEILWLTAAQLRANKDYDQKKVEKLIEAEGRARQNVDRQQKDNRSGYYKLYEVHGELPVSYLTKKAKDDKVYQQQMHVFSYCEGEKTDEYDDFVLYSGKEEKDPYMLTHLIRRDGRALSIGAVEYAFEAQWMVNHNAKLIKDQLDLVSKVITQTSDPTFLGQNILTSLETGDILVHAANSPLTRVDTRPDIAAMQNFGTQWAQAVKEITSTPDAMRGVQTHAGAAYRQQAALTQQADSLFKTMLQNRSFDIERMMREFILPFIKRTKLANADELSVTLDEQGIQEFDSLYVPSRVIRANNDHIKSTVLSGQVAFPMNPADVEQNVRQGLSQLGNRRYLKPSDIDGESWKQALEDFEWEVEVDAAGEEEDTNAIMTTLSNLFRDIAGNPQILQDPNARMIFNKILEQTSAISPLEVAMVPPPQPQPQPQPGQQTAQPTPAQPGGQQ